MPMQDRQATEREDIPRTQGATLRDFLSVLFRRKWIIILAVVASVAVVLYTALRIVPTYESYAQLLVSRGQPTSAYNANVRMLSWEEELSSEIEAVRSARIYKRAQEILTAAGAQDSGGNPIQIDPAKVDANIPGKSSVIHVLYRGRDPQAVRQVVQALSQSYREFRSSARNQDPSSELQRQIDQLSQEIDDWERQRAEFLTREGAVELPQERVSLLASKRTLEADLATADAVVAERESRVIWMHDLLSGGDTTPSGGLYSFSDPDERGESVLMVLRKLILNTEAEYFEARAQYTDSHPNVLTLHARLEDLRKALTREGEAYLGYLNAQLEAARARVNSLQASLDYADQRLATFPDKEAQLFHLDRMLSSLRTTHDALVRSQADALSMRLGSNLWDVVVLQDAVPPYRVRGVDYVRLAVIPIFSLLVAIGLAFLFDNLDPSFKESREAEQQLGIPVLGEVRHFRK